MNVSHGRGIRLRKPILGSALRPLLIAFAATPIWCAAPLHGDESAPRAHWAFVPPERPASRPIDIALATREPIDRLHLEHLASRGLSASPRADRRTLVRRLYNDLVGLPPTHAEVEAFLADASPLAYEKLVDRLLASPQFGERWARYWLDVARFGDTKGYVFTEKRDYPHAYKYRDWVIEAFSSDLPIDTFLKYQLVADQLVADDDTTALAALGYVTLGRRFINNKHDIIDDRIDVVFRGMMGLTVACARCHDHKYDPVSTRDYYALYGVFASSPEHQDDDLPLGLREAEQPHDVHVFARGNPSQPTEIAPRRFPEFFDPDGEPFREGSGRRDLADAIVDADNPLTARVFVNRVWGSLMGITAGFHAKRFRDAYRPSRVSGHP